MIRIIRNHNRLNGLRFSVVEFLLMALLCLAIAAWFAVAGALILGLLALGIGAKCLTVAAFGVASLRAGQPDIGLRGVFSAAERARLIREQPMMQRDTYILAGVTLLPWVVMGLTIVERVRSRGRSS